jgi:hypothetical protein
MARRLPAAAVAALLAGCAAQPQTAEEFRRAIPHGLFAGTGSIEVNRPFAKVAATFGKMAPECLQGSVTTTRQIITRFRVITREYFTAWKPTVAMAQERAELHVQAQTAGEIHLSRSPLGGPYRLVADAYPVHAGRTRLQWFSARDPLGGPDYLVRAITGWASGESMQCPDLMTEWDRTREWAR